MSFWNFIFGGGETTKNKKLVFGDDGKLSRQEILDLVWNIKSLDYKQRELVKRELIKELDDGGVTPFEYKEVIRKMSLKRVELGLSEVDIQNLRKVL